MPTYLPAFMSHAHLDNDLCDLYHRALAQRGAWDIDKESEGKVTRRGNTE